MSKKRGTGMRILAGSMAGVLLLTSCASAPPPQTAASVEPGRPFTAEEERMRTQAADYNRTIAEGIAVGAAAGAGAGALAGLAACRGKLDCMLIGMAIGAVLGAGLGGFGGKYYADKKERYVNEEQRLDAITVDFRNNNTKLEDEIANIRLVTLDNKKRIEAVKRDLAAQRMSAEQARKELATIDSNRTFLQTRVDELKKLRNDFREVAQQARADSGNNPRVAQMDSEINAMERQITRLQGELDALSSRRASVVG
ncbi:putative Glycine zipper [Candidatus Defluviicoccus seviourii]|uniref:Glycine zipper n=2 Tax=root TaxID=1 RepID=A0A564WFU6_9PROT|nr:putative Glycine zipper [uncultured Defluviicoccus sp.]VUX47342.1 putative Glycine zipper [Candidatus Defluviicoccus seviourii]